MLAYEARVRGVAEVEFTAAQSSVHNMVCPIHRILPIHNLTTVSSSRQHSRVIIHPMDTWRTGASAASWPNLISSHTRLRITRCHTSCASYGYPSSRK